MEAPIVPTPASLTPVPLDRFAWRVSGPRDFAINLALNTAIPWYTLAGAETIPLLGPKSFILYLVPMMMMMFGSTTFFAYFGGIRERRLGRALPPCEADIRWVRAAIRSGLWYGALGLAIGLCLAGLLSWLAPAAMPRTIASVALGLWSAVLAFVVSVLAVKRSAYIGVAADAPAPSAP